MIFMHLNLKFCITLQQKLYYLKFLLDSYKHKEYWFFFLGYASFDRFYDSENVRSQAAFKLSPYSSYLSLQMRRYTVRKNYTIIIYSTVTSFIMPILNICHMPLGRAMNGVGLADWNNFFPFVRKQLLLIL